MAGRGKLVQFPGHLTLIFGPAPAQATQVRISPASAEPTCAAARGEPTITRPISHSLPSWAPDGKWFVVSDSQLSCVENVTFLNANGQIVDDHDFH
jgi:hypothetical protein